MSLRVRRGHVSIPAALLLALVCAASAIAAALWLYARSQFSLLEAGPGETFSTKVYAAPFVLDGSPVAPQALLERLDRLSYQRVGTTPDAPGQYEWFPPHLTVYLRGFKTPMLEQDPVLADFTLSTGALWTLRSYAGVVLPSAALEPELATELSGPRRVRREEASWQEIPQALKDAAVAAEDKRFYSHHGVDPRALLRAAFADLRGRPIAGGSTITQQLAKNLFLSPRRTLKRKVLEAALALYIETRLSKQEILTRYLNHIYLGQNGTVSIAGVKAAARFYFDKSLSSLDLPECAFLAGAIRSPYLYNPWRDPAAAKERRDHVLVRMFDDGMIPQSALAQALLEPLRPGPAPRPGTGDQDAYFTAEVVRRLLPAFGEDELYKDGLSIYTTLDPVLQGIAQRTVLGAAHQAALAALDPRTGDVLALVGGTDFEQSQFDRATQAERQPGSAFKPVAYAAALEAGLTPLTVLRDQPKAWVDASGRRWKPRNYDGVYFGTTTVREALAHSLNGATLDLASRIGPERIVAMARRLGIESPLKPDLSLALGAYEVNLLELTGAYAAFDNGGFRVQPRLVAAVADAEGKTLELDPVQREAALSPAVAYLTTSLLESVVQEGTARGLAKLGFTRPAAGKTGTTNLGSDAWFIGFTPELVAGVWTGEDVRQPLGLTGAKDALPLWAAFMKPALDSSPPEDFKAPPGVVAAVVDPVTGFLATAACPQRRTEYFINGTQPTVFCPVHKPAPVSWWKRLFKW